MKVLVLGGFLGSGKTTVLLKLAAWITAHSSRPMPLAIIENEVGEVSVDGAALRGYQVRELSAGCICCTLTAGLGMAIRQLYQDYDPEYIIVEATGLAHMDKITEVIRRYLPEVSWLRAVVLADVARWDSLMEGLDVFLENQLRGGDDILLNKCDLVSEEDRMRLAEELKALHPGGRLLMVSARSDISEAIQTILESGIDNETAVPGEEKGGNL